MDTQYCVLLFSVLHLNGAAATDLGNVFQVVKAFSPLFFCLSTVLFIELSFYAFIMRKKGKELKRVVRNKTS